MGQIEPTALSLHNYWQHVIDPIQQAPWFNERQAGRDIELWNALNAMTGVVRDRAEDVRADLRYDALPSPA